MWTRTDLQQPVSSGSGRVWPWRGGVLWQAPLSPEPRACQRSLLLAKHQSALRNRPAQKILLFWGLGEMPNDLVGLLPELKSLQLFILVKKAFHSSFETEERKSLFYIRRSNLTFLDGTKCKPVTGCTWAWLDVGWCFFTVWGQRVRRQDSGSRSIAKPLSVGLKADVQRSTLVAKSLSLSYFLKRKDIQDHWHKIISIQNISMINFLASTPNISPY